MEIFSFVGLVSCLYRNHSTELFRDPADITVYFHSFDEIHDINCIKMQSTASYDVKNIYIAGLYLKEKYPIGF